MASTSAIPAVEDMTQVEDAADDEVDDFVCFGRFRSVIVGIQYYTGTVNNNEMVQLVREPDNVYDSWAIRVDNVRGQKVGHLKRDLVSHLAHLVDQRQLRLEGVVPSGGNNRFTLPVMMYCYGPPAAEAAVLRSVKMADMCMETVDRGVAITGGVPDQLSMARITPAEMESCLDRLFTDMVKGRPREFMEPAAEVVSPLYPHQKQALAWMVRSEIAGALPPFWEPRKPRTTSGPPLTYVNTLTNFCSDTRPSPLRGGIMADDMGLGKTLQMIALVATNRAGTPLPPVAVEVREEAPASAPPTKKRKTAKGVAAHFLDSPPMQDPHIPPLGLPSSPSKLQPSPLDPNLMPPHPMHLPQQPPQLMHQQQQQVPQTLPCLEQLPIDPQALQQPLPPHHHQQQQQHEQPLRNSLRQQQHQQRQLVAATPAKVAYLQPQPAKKLSKAQAKLAELAAAASPPAELPLEGGPKATLVVCPLSVVSNWVGQVEEHTAGLLQVYQYHGPERNRSVQWLASQDIVVTTYGTLSAEMGRDASDGLLAVKWLRVVLDEAHVVKNTNSQQSRAVHQLHSLYRWAVTGTPIQNKLADLYSLLSWLRLEPLHDRILFNRTIQRPIHSNDARGLIRLQVLLSAVALRRTKGLVIDGRPIVELPRRSVHVTAVQLTPEDRRKYDHWEMEGRRIISRHISASTLLSNYSSVLEIILRLRQICCAGSLCPLDAPGGSDLDSAAPHVPPTPELLQRLLVVLQSGAEECPICLADLQAPCITRCGHAYCRRCIEAVIAMDKPSCPLCRQHISTQDLFDAPPEAEAEAAPEDGGGGGGGCEGGGGRARSAKVAVLMVQLMAAAQQGIKSVVFSQFTGMLDLAAAAMRDDGIPFVRLDGKTPARQRVAALAAFASAAPGSPVVFLASLKAAGVGLNLTSASHVHLLDPWWNPAVEEQAMDRVHRLGQVRPVEVFRYVAEGTIEERMLALQERKRTLATAGFERGNLEQQRQMRLDDVKLLMEL